MAPKSIEARRLIAARTKEVRHQAGNQLQQRIDVSADRIRRIHVGVIVSGEHFPEVAADAKDGAGGIGHIGIARHLGDKRRDDDVGRRYGRVDGAAPRPISPELRRILAEIGVTLPPREPAADAAIDHVKPPIPAQPRGGCNHSTTSRWRIWFARFVIAAKVWAVRLAIMALVAAGFGGVALLISSSIPIAILAAAFGGALVARRACRITGDDMTF